jgi:hypothetical protein
MLCHDLTFASTNMFVFADGQRSSPRGGVRERCGGKPIETNNTNVRCRGMHHVEEGGQQSLGNSVAGGVVIVAEFSGFLCIMRQARKLAFYYFCGILLIVCIINGS